MGRDIRMEEGVTWAVVMATVSGLGAAAIGIIVVDVVLGNPVGSFDVVVVPPAVVATAMLGGTLWWVLIERPRRLTDQRAMIVGCLVGVLAHPLTWILYALGSPLFLPGGWSQPWVMVESTLVFAMFSMLFSGILTIIGGILCGLAVMRIRRRSSAVT